MLVTPTPIVGPDRGGGKKADNHANEAFATEGKELREWIKAHGKGKLFIVCGDRHWQYHSQDPETGVHEICCGPTTDKHAGGSPGEEPKYHKFHRVAGGFLSVSVAWAGDKSTLSFRLHDVHGKQVYEWKPDAGR